MYLTNPSRKCLPKVRKIKLLGGGEALFPMTDIQLLLYNANLELFETIVRVSVKLNPSPGLSFGDCSQLSIQSELGHETFQKQVDT